jgi:hypothetical protein
MGAMVAAAERNAGVRTVRHADLSYSSASTAIARACTSRSAGAGASRVDFLRKPALPNYSHASADRDEYAHAGADEHADAETDQHANEYADKYAHGDADAARDDDRAERGTATTQEHGLER